MVSRKTSGRSLFTLLLLLLAPLGFATETRVDSTGGLGLILTDETQAPNPFMAGNPAGLALLEPQNRFDVAGQWFCQNDASNHLATGVWGTLANWFRQNDQASNNGTRVYGALNELGPDSMKYHGFILFPAKGWAVQADGDLYHIENQPGLDFQSRDLDRTRELFRTACHFGPFVLGADAQAGQVNLAVQPGSFYGAPLLGGTGTANTLAANSGLLIPFPANPRPNENRFLLGGVFSMELVPSKETEVFSLSIPPGSTLLNLTQTLTEDRAQSYGPELYFQVPNALEAALLVRLTNGSRSLQIDSSNPGLVPSIPSFKLEDSDGFAVLAAFKANSPLFKTTSLKSGLTFFFGSGNNTLYDQTQAVTSHDSSQTWKVQGGIGMEGLLDYTVGLQVEAGELTGSNRPTAGTPQTPDLFTYKIALGGERWISKQWAFRGGILFQSDQNRGTTPFPRLLYTLGNGQSVLSTTVTAGAGFKESSVQMDFLLWIGQPYLYNSANPNDFKTQAGVQLAASLFFN